MWEEAPPKAYLNYLLFDENFVLVDGGFDQVSTDCEQESDLDPVAPHDYLSLHVKVEQKGYLYVYLSNEQAVLTNVYFDDMKIVQYSAVEQVSDYYPFGLTFNCYQRENSVKQRYKFQGQEHIDDLGLNWDSFKWRNHQPDIGRFFNVDPLAAKYVYNSPYAFSENHVTSHVELEGLEKISIHSRSFAPYNSFGVAFLGDGANRKFSTNAAASSRISGSVGLNLSGRGITQTGPPDAQGSVSVNLATGTSSKSNARMMSMFSQERSDGTSAKTDLGFHLSGNNSQVPGSSDIDVKSQMQVSVVEMGEEGSMATFSGAVTGDRFPANETYVTDQSGAGVFLGVSGAYVGEGNEHTGPFTQLPGDNNTPMSQFSISIGFDAEGNIQNVQYQRKTYSVEDWNKQFQNQNPQSNSTSTNYR